jgi:hypothetical protein
MPAWQLSGCVQMSPSLQDVPSAFGGFEQPVAGEQTPTLWHWSEATQTTGPPAWHVPPEHVSFWVQRFPSSHGPVLFVKTHPVAGLHVSVVQALPSLQTTGEPPHVPPVQTSPLVQALPSLHPDPSAFAGLEQTPVPVLHVPATWH